MVAILPPSRPLEGLTRARPIAILREIAFGPSLVWHVITVESVRSSPRLTGLGPRLPLHSGQEANVVDTRHDTAHGRQARLRTQIAWPTLMRPRSDIASIGASAILPRIPRQLVRLAAYLDMKAPDDEASDRFCTARPTPVSRPISPFELSERIAVGLWCDSSRCTADLRLGYTPATAGGPPFLTAK